MWERDQVRPRFVREKSSNGLFSTVTRVLPGSTPNRESNYYLFVFCFCFCFSPTIFFLCSPEYLVAVDPCPFYPQGGGQVGDTGALLLDNGTRLTVTDTLRPYENGAVLVVDADQSSSGHQITAVRKPFFFFSPSLLLPLLKHSWYKNKIKKRDCQ